MVIFSLLLDTDAVMPGAFRPATSFLSFFFLIGFSLSLSPSIIFFANAYHLKDEWCYIITEQDAIQ